MSPWMRLGLDHQNKRKGHVFFSQLTASSSSSSAFAASSETPPPPAASFFFQVIKARIHGLIEREYLERDPNQANHYSYLA